MTFYQTMTTEDLSLFYPICILLSSSNVSKKVFLSVCDAFAFYIPHFRRVAATFLLSLKFLWNPSLHIDGRVRLV